MSKADDELNRKACEITKEFYERYGPPKCGMKVFLSPMRENPDLAIVSYNPGGDKNMAAELQQLKSGNFCPPESNDYDPSGRETDKLFMRGLFCLFSGHDELLRTSVPFYLIPYRSARESGLFSKKAGLFGKLSTREKKEFKDFCAEKAHEILFMIQPKAKLVIGFGTYDLLERNNTDSAKRPRGSKRNSFQPSQDRKMLVIRHLSAPGQMQKDASMDGLREEFADWLRRCGVG